MSEHPLVSVMMPAYNSGRTISFALASLIAQTYENWECVVVDDGSTDDTLAQASAIRDPRIKILAQRENAGEAAARQIAIDNSKGALFAMLDADDWLYPEKLAKQVETIKTSGDLFLVSCGMAIAGLDGNLLGVRAAGSGERARYLRPGDLPVAHASSLFRRDGFGHVGYDIKMKMASDSDFLRRTMLGRTYVVMPYVGYCYRELGSARLGKIVAGYYYNARGLAKFLKAKPLPVAWCILQELGKMVVYLILGPLGLFRVLIRRRSRPPSDAEREEFLRAKAVVEAVHERILAEKSR